MSTKTYENMMRYYDDNPNTDPELQRSVWSNHKWVANVNDVIEIDDGRSAMRKWCGENLGHAADPLFGVAGRWYAPRSTLNGWALWGFTTEEDMIAFCEAFPKMVRHAA